MPISKKYKHGDEVIFLVDGYKPLKENKRHVVGKVIGIDHLYTREDKSIWRREFIKGERIYKMPFLIVKWDKSYTIYNYVECVAEENLAPVPKAVKVLYGKA